MEKNKVMKANEAPEKIWINSPQDLPCSSVDSNSIEYIRTDAFIEKAKKWFECQNEWIDLDGVRHCDLEDFEDFRKYMGGE